MLKLTYVNMNNAIISIAFAFVFLGIAENSSASGYTARIEKFDSHEYVFVGEITDFISEENDIEVKLQRYDSDKESAFEIKRRRNRMVGFRVKVHDPVYLPKPSKFYNIYLFSRPSEESVKEYEDRLLQLFNVGDNVRLFGHEFRILKSSSGDENINLRVNLGDVRLNEIDGEIITTSSRVADYEQYAKLLNNVENVCCKDCNEKKDEYEEFVKESKTDVLRFELRKDLFRLEAAENEEEKQVIFDRLKIYPNESEIDLEKIERNYFTSRRVDKETNHVLYARLVSEIDEMLSDFRRKIVADDYRGALAYELESQKVLTNKDLDHYKKYFNREDLYKEKEIVYLGKTKAYVKFTISEQKPQVKNGGIEDARNWWRLNYLYGVYGFELKLIKTPSGWKIYHHFI